MDNRFFFIGGSDLGASQPRSVGVPEGEGYQRRSTHYFLGFAR
jgi:hypothetical protein